MQAAVAFAAAAVLAAAGYRDVLTRRIPNGLALAVAGLALARLALAADPAAAGWSLAAAALVLAFGFVLFAFGIVGGGDAKLLAAAALLVGVRDLAPFLLLMSLLGGVVGLAALVYGRLRPRLAAAGLAVFGRRRLGAWCAGRPRLARLVLAGAAGPEGPLSVPYGVAIAAAGIVILALQLSLHR